MNFVEMVPKPSAFEHQSASSQLADDPAPSWQSRFLNALLGTLPIKQRTASAAAVQAHVRKLALRPASYAPSGVGRDVDIRLKNAEGWPVYHTAPVANPNDGNYVVFVHGGGFINEIVPAHWRFIGGLTRTANVRCVVPIYPLAPAATAQHLVPTMGELLRNLLSEAGPAKVTVVGNSAGAGLALAAAQWLRDHGHRQPDGLVLISPAVDAALDRPEHGAVAASDPLQDVPGMLEAARLYAGDLDTAHTYISPLNGALHDLAPMLVFSGTRDLLYPDSLELAAKARAANVPVELHLRRGQPHNYAFLPTPEGRAARALIARTVA